MDPITFVILVAAIAGRKGISDFFQNVPYMVRGGTPPSHERRMQEMAHREAARNRRHQRRMARGQRAEGKARAYFGALWDHSWQTAAEHRRAKWEKRDPIRSQRYAEKIQAKLDGTYRSPIRRGVDRGRALHERAKRTAQEAGARVVADKGVRDEMRKQAPDAAEWQLAQMAKEQADQSVVHYGPDGQPLDDQPPDTDPSAAAEPSPDGDAAAEAPTTATERDGWTSVGGTQPGRREYRRDTGDGTQLGVRDHASGGVEWVSRRGDEVTSGIAANMDEAFTEAETAARDSYPGYDGPCPPDCDWCAAEATTESQARNADGDMTHVAYSCDTHNPDARALAEEHKGAPTTSNGTAHEGDTMTQMPTGEATGVSDAIAAARAWNQMFAGSEAAAESLASSLQAGDVGPQATQLCATIQESVRTAVNASQQLEDILGQSVRVGEEYAANPEAGNEQFVTDGARRH